MNQTVLIIEDERAIVEILKYNLQKEGYDTLEALDGEQGLRLAHEANPDLVLLDVMLPKINGFDVCNTLRDEGSVIPIIMLTAKGEESDKVFGLEAGADDYITKPFSMRELLARVKANVRRHSMDSGKKGGAVSSYGELRIDRANYTATKSGAGLALTQKEYDLLCFLSDHPGKVFTREELMKQVWDYEFFGDTRTVDVTVRRLREKIEDCPSKPVYILTKRSVGYYFSEEYEP